MLHRRSLLTALGAGAAATTLIAAAGAVQAAPLAQTAAEDFAGATAGPGQPLEMRHRRGHRRHRAHAHRRRHHHHRRVRRRARPARPAQ